MMANDLFPVVMTVYPLEHCCPFHALREDDILCPTAYVVTQCSDRELHNLRLGPTKWHLVRLRGTTVDKSLTQQAGRKSPRGLVSAGVTVCVNLHYTSIIKYVSHAQVCTTGVTVYHKVCFSVTYAL